MRVTQHQPRPSGMKSLVIVFTAVCAVLSFDLEPGDDAPLYHLKTLNGFVDRREMTVFYALDNRSAFVECLWTKNESVDHLIQNSSSDVQYVFMSFSESAEGHVSWMQNRLKSRVEFLSNETGIRFDGFLKRAHFVIHSAGKTGTWIDWLLGNWTCRDHGCGINQLNITTAASGKLEEALPFEILELFRTCVNTTPALECHNCSIGFISGMAGKPVLSHEIP